MQMTDEQQLLAENTRLRERVKHLEIQLAEADGWQERAIRLADALGDAARASLVFAQLLETRCGNLE